MSRTWRPTHRQKIVMALLANRGEMSARDVEEQYLQIGEKTARSIFLSLSQRGLVDVAGFQSGDGRRDRRTYKLTDKGAEFEAEHNNINLEDLHEQDDPEAT